MIAFNGKYLVYASGIAMIVTAVVQTIYSVLTGLPMAATLPGLIISLLLFVGTTLVALAYYKRKSTVDVDQLIDVYNEACDPSAFVSQSQMYVNGMNPPYDNASSWFMSYYAQALLDLGRVSEAQKIEQDMYESIKESTGLEQQAKIIVNLVPLAQKLLGPADTVPIIQKGLELLQTGEAGKDAPAYEAYLQNQLVICTALAENDVEKLVRFYSSARNNETMPLRIRVEQAWEEAKIHYAQGDTQREIECLEFISTKGNKLAFVKQAHDRLVSLS